MAARLLYLDRLCDVAESAGREPVRIIGMRVGFGEASFNLEWVVMNASVAGFASLRPRKLRLNGVDDRVPLLWGDSDEYERDSRGAWALTEKVVETAFVMGRTGRHLGLHLFHRHDLNSDID